MSERIIPIVSIVQKARKASLEAAEYHWGEYHKFLRAEALQFINTFGDINQTLGSEGNNIFKGFNSFNETNLTVEGLKYGVPYEKYELAFARVASKIHKI